LYKPTQQEKGGEEIQSSWLNKNITRKGWIRLFNIWFSLSFFLKSL